MNEIQNQQQLDSLNGLSVINFWADWAKPCLQMNVVCEALAKQYPSVTFFKVEAEQFEDLTTKYGVTAVPYFVLLNGGNIVDRLEGANPPELTKKLAKLNQEKPVSSGVSSAVTETEQSKANSLKARLEKLVNFAPVMLFMKGSPDAPQCGFSSKIADILKKDGIQFSSFNILSDEEVRVGLKAYSNWPTFPQLYIQGKLVGGLDVVKELSEQGELTPMVPDKTNDLNAKLQKLVTSAPVMLFMKGTAEAPKCGFSAKIVDLLKEQGVKFGGFDILTDEAVREGLKAYSKWPTFPQLYANGKLVGGLDVVKELAEQGELKSMLPAEAIALT